jgi:hypothetical protein
MVKLHFLPIKTTQSGGKTKKAQELEDLEARSYAAHVSHARAGRGSLVKAKMSDTRNITALHTNAKTGPSVWQHGEKEVFRSPRIASIADGDGHAPNQIRPIPFDEAATTGPVYYPHQSSDHPRDEYSRQRRDIGNLAGCEDVDEDIEEIVRGGFDDIFPNIGNVTIPFLASYSSKFRRTRLPVLFESYLRDFGPNHMWRPSLTAPNRLAAFKRDYFALSMQDPMVLEGVFEACQNRMDLKAVPNGPQSAASLQHRGRLLEMVHGALSKSQNEISEALLWTILGMTGVDAFSSDWSSFNTNWTGFQQIVAIRGGVDSLGW